jgi:hypothetical protein
MYTRGYWGVSGACWSGAQPARQGRVQGRVMPRVVRGCCLDPTVTQRQPYNAIVLQISVMQLCHVLQACCKPLA